MPPWVELERWELRLEARRAPVNVFVLETAEPPEE